MDRIVPAEKIDDEIFIGPHRLPRRTEIFNFGGKFLIIASVVRPNEDIKHIGGTHFDSHISGLKWPSPEEAIKKVSVKAADMEVKCRIHKPQYAGCKFGSFAFDAAYIFGPKRKEMARGLGQVLNYYNGRVYSGLDANITMHDAIVASETSPYVLGMPTMLGGCDDPSPFTARTIVQIQSEAIKRFIDPDHPSLRGKTIIVKGALGKVGQVVVTELFEKGASLMVADHPSRFDELIKFMKRFPGIGRVWSDRIHETPAHIFCPVDTTTTLPDMRTARGLRLFMGSGFFRGGIIGSSNDQCRSDTIEWYLFRKRILHFSENGALENGAGFVAVANELEGFSSRRLEKELAALVQKTTEVGEESIRQKKPSFLIVKERFLS